MKKTGLLLCILLASLGRLSAQVTVEVLTDQDEFLVGEAIPVGARITNRSGQTLKLGRDEGWLKFSVEARDGYVVLKNGEAPVSGQEFTLESSDRATVHADLAPYFHLPRPGRYLITATINIPEWGKLISSEPKGFDVINGAKLWEQEFGVPKAPGDTNAVPEMRRYALQEANYLRSRLTLYIQVTDDSGKIQKVIPVGPMLSFGQPDPKVDKMSNLHVLYRNGPNSYSYTVVNPDGDIILRQTYDYTSLPKLVADTEGNFAVAGGTRRITHNDIPPPKIPSNDVPVAPKP